MILSGSTGGINIDSTPAARCTGWTLNLDRDLSDGTPVYRWGERLRAGEHGGAGEATFLCDPESAAGAAFLASIRDDEPDPLAMILLTEDATGFSFLAHVSRHVVDVMTRNVSRARVSFQATGDITEIV